MKWIPVVVGSVVGAAVLAGVLVLTLRPDWLKSHAVAAEEKPAETDVPVKAALVTRATLRRYVEGFGAVEPEPASDGRPAAGAAIASPLAGMVAAVLCAPGQRVEKGAVLIQLDDRLATAQEEQARSALESAKAALAKVKSAPRPEQLEMAGLAVQKAKGAADLAERNYERQKKLVEQAASAKTVQTAEADLNAARLDQRSAEKQLALLKASPTPEELAEAAAKVREAESALAVAGAQRNLLKIQAPLAATVLRVAVNPGEAVDPTKVLVELAAMDRLALNVTVSAKALPSLKTGLPAEIFLQEPRVSEADGGASSTTRPADEAGESIKGTVKWIGYQVDRKTDSVSVWVAAPPDALLRPGQYARVRIVVEEHADCLAVPVDGVVTDADGNSVIALVRGEKAAQVNVRTGLRDRNRVEVRGEGFKEGDTVVTEGAYGLPKETKVHVTGG